MGRPKGLAGSIDSGLSHSLIGELASLIRVKNSLLQASGIPQRDQENWRTYKGLPRTGPQTQTLNVPCFSEFSLLAGKYRETVTAGKRRRPTPYGQRVLRDFEAEIEGPLTERGP